LHRAQEKSVATARRSGEYQCWMAEDLVALLQKRKYTQALEILVETCGKRVFGMAIAMLGNEARAEEATQDVFLKVWRALPLYDGRAAPSTWLYAIARNTCLSALRSEALRRTIPLEESAEPAKGETVSRDVELNQILRRLPEVQREAVTLFYLQERSVEEVALLLDLPEGTVKSHLHRGRRALGDMMRETQWTATKRRS
jgi:RNA polymerase sigma-70 factor (ECF subfamily)